MIMDYREVTQRKWAPIVLALALTMMAAAGFAFQNPAKHLTMNEAKSLAVKAADGEIPLTVNDLVLAELNAIIGTEGGRRNFHDAMERMPQYKAMIDARSAQYHVPPEILAVPVVESGFQNLNGSFAAGLWGFIAPTARHFGLTVNDQIDERLDVDRETVAAMRYFTVLHGLFDDWRLALLGYNMGESAVQKAMDTLGTRDPWAVERAHLNDERYLARVTATIIVMKNPSLYN